MKFVLRWLGVLLYVALGVAQLALFDFAMAPAALVDGVQVEEPGTRNVDQR